MANLVRMENDVNNFKQMAFDNADFGEVRTMVIDGEPWFVGKDVATCLGYKNTKDALVKHVDEEDKIMGSQNATPSIVDKMGRLQYPTFINESGMYALIFGSKMEKAKEFKRWVTSEVLPTLRKTGKYEMQDNQNIGQILSEMADFKIIYAEQMTKLGEVLTQQTESFGKVMDNLTIDTKKQNQIQKAAKERVGRLLGGAHSQLYKEKSRLYFSNLWHQLKDQFECGSYKDLSPADYEDALGITKSVEDEKK